MSRWRKSIDHVHGEPSVETEKKEKSEAAEETKQLSESDLQTLLRELQQQVKDLREQTKMDEQTFYASMRSQRCEDTSLMPIRGMPARHARQIIYDGHLLDSREQLNTASYVNVVFEPEEEDVVKMGMCVNLADQTTYPNSFKMHNHVVNMLATLWHCPEPPDFATSKTYVGAGTVGSTEACLLAGLAFKFRWRAWYAKRHNLSHVEVRKVYPNLVISTCYQACWEKFFLYMDVEPRFVVPKGFSFTVTPEAIKELIDEHTIGVVCIMGNHYAGQYDPVWDVDAMLTHLNKEKGFQVGIHVDGASGGFIAPFQSDTRPWDFRLPNVLSISSSGHKFGASVCGTGWVVWRQKADLSEHVAIKVTYLGGSADSYTLNFSRPASGVYVQLYKFLRMGVEGYTTLMNNMMANAAFLRQGLKEMTKNSLPRFIMLDAGDSGCLPVVAARLNPKLNLKYDEVDLQHLIAEDHWYVSAYHLNFHHPTEKKNVPLLDGVDPEASMFRIVVKSNLTHELATNLLESMAKAVEWLDTHGNTIVKHKAPDWPSLLKLGIKKGNQPC